MGGPLTADMINLEVEANKESIAFLVQMALVLLGSASHSINLERRKIAWARINPNIKSIVTEQYEDRKDNLFGPGFFAQQQQQQQQWWQQQQLHQSYKGNQ